jgi:hypothetical protein
VYDPDCVEALLADTRRHSTAGPARDTTTVTAMKLDISVIRHGMRKGNRPNAPAV